MGEYLIILLSPFCLNQVFSCEIVVQMNRLQSFGKHKARMLNLEAVSREEKNNTFQIQGSWDR